jgi:hypothetical protein
MDIDQSHPSSGLSLRELRAVLKKNGDYNNNEAALKKLFGAMDADGSGDEEGVDDDRVDDGELGGRLGEDLFSGGGVIHGILEKEGHVYASFKI